MAGILPITHLPLPYWLIGDRGVTSFYLDLPLPPSTNDLWKIALTYRNGACVGAKMVKTDRYKEWWDEAGYGARWPQGYEDWRGIVLLYLDLGEMKAGRDTDNCLKAAQDLAAAMLGVNDSCFHWAAAFRSEDHGIAAGRCGLTLILVEG